MAPRIEQFPAYTLNCRLGVSGFATAGGTSDTITQALTSTLSTASRSGGSVPLQVGSNVQEGVETAAGKNLTPLYTAAGQRYQDANGNDVYGKVTVSGSTWSLGYFSAPGGVEAPFTMPAAASIGFEFDYCFTLADLPRSAISATTDRRIAPDPAQTGTRLFSEQLTVTSNNTLSAATNAQSGAVAMIVVNQFTYRTIGSAPHCSVSGKTWTWSQANAGFALIPGDDVEIVYSY